LNSEFELIELFKNIGSEYYKDNGIIISPGDDCAAFKFNKSIVTSIDASIEGVHFPKNAKPSDIAYRSIAVALSDIAAMACKPLAFSLSITVPHNEYDWFESFQEGAKDISDEYKISLIGGDLTSGPLNVNVVVYGSPYSEKILTRSGAKPGDIICISSQVGKALKGLKDWNNNIDSSFIDYYLRPKAKIELGKEISLSANACIDTSDGLLADLKKMLDASNCGADIYIDDIPITSGINDLNAGDDYDLCFTLPEEMVASNFIKIGVVKEDKEINLCSNKGYDIEIKGYEHY
jgi:thiamine-monophosphate kinase